MAYDVNDARHQARNETAQAMFWMMGRSGMTKEQMLTCLTEAQKHLHAAVTLMDEEVTAWLSDGIIPAPLSDFGSSEGQEQEPESEDVDSPGW